VDYEKLEKILKMDIKLENNPQLSLLSQNTMAKDVAFLPQQLDMHDAPIEELSMKYVFETPSWFNKNKLSTVLKKYPHLVITGIDNNGNTIKITDSIELSIDTNLAFSNFTELDGIPIKAIVSELEEKERGALNDYKDNY